MRKFVGINLRFSKFQKRIHINLRDFVFTVSSGRAGVSSLTTGKALNLVGVMVSYSLILTFLALGHPLGVEFCPYDLSNFFLFLTFFTALTLFGATNLFFQKVKPSPLMEEIEINSLKIRALIALAHFAFNSCLSILSKKDIFKN